MKPVPKSLHKPKLSRNPYVNQNCPEMFILIKTVPRLITARLTRLILFAKSYSMIKFKR